ncbi:MAG: hypothetical protein AAGF20_10775 [Pseudomonadota bacterium]
MDLKRITGFALGLIATFMMWQSGIALAQYFHAYGWSQFTALLFDPEYSLRLISAMAAFIAGLAALTERQGGAWLAGFASALLLIQTLALAAGHGHVHNWQNEAIYLSVMTCLFLALVVSNGRRAREAEILKARDVAAV